jgi:hypothetical protein
MGLAARCVKSGHNTVARNRFISRRFGATNGAASNRWSFAALVLSPDLSEQSLNLLVIEEVTK